MSKFYIAPNRRGLMIKIVEDVRVPVSPKLSQLGEMQAPYIICQRLVARFVNEAECAEFMAAYNAHNSDDESGTIHITEDNNDEARSTF